MGVELRPFGVACNLACTYCYQNPMRESGNLRQTYDMAKMKAALEREGSSFILLRRAAADGDRGPGGAIRLWLRAVRQQRDPDQWRADRRRPYRDVPQVQGSR